jgi:pseudaminic acid cytidylyltransferase
MPNLAVIPARGGSKRIPNKNIKNFLGKPIIQYSIEVAKLSGLFDEVIVSTDDDKIKSLAMSLGANVPFTRSEKNSDDFATLTDVLLEVIDNYYAVGKHFEFVCLILPTAPLIYARSLVEAHQLLANDSNCSSVVPVVRFSYPVQRAFIVNEKRYLKILYPEFKFTRSQDIAPAYHDSAQFYWVRVADFLKEKSIFTESTRCIELNELQVQDIDNETDWKLAEIKYSLLHKSHEAES